MTYNLANICKAANRFHAQGYSRSAAFRMAWRLAKQTAQIAVAGTTHSDRQDVLAAIAGTAPETVTVELYRDRENLYDSNAVAVFVRDGERLHKLGYVPAKAAACISVLIDTGLTVRATLLRVVGGWSEGLRYGARLSLAL